MDNLKQVLIDLKNAPKERKPLEIVVDNAKKQIEEEGNAVLQPLKVRDDFEKILLIERARWIQVLNLTISAYTQRCERAKTKKNFAIDGKNFVVSGGNVFSEDQIITTDQLINDVIVGKELDRVYLAVNQYFNLEENGTLGDLRYAIVALRGYQKRLEEQGLLIQKNFHEYRRDFMKFQDWKLSNRNLIKQYWINLSWKGKILTLLIPIITLILLSFRWF